MAGMQIFLFCLPFVILGVQTKSLSDQLQDQGQNRTKPPGQRMCYLVSDSDAKNIAVIYFRVDDRKLYDRQGRPLPDCPSVSVVVELDNCNVCVREEQVRAECNLTDPSAVLDFETSSKTLNKTKTPCGWTTTTTTTTTAPPILTTTPPPGLSATHITLIIVGVVVLLVVVLAVGYWIMSCKERCGHEPVPTDENKTGRTPRHLAANGHGPLRPSPRPSPRPSQSV